MFNWKTLAGGVAVSAMAVAAAQHAEAQVTTSSIRGIVTDSTGSAVSGANVTIIHVPTGTVSMSTTGASGAFNARNLRVGGPYTVTIEGEGIAPSRAEDVLTSLGDSTQVNLVVERVDDARTLQTVVVTGSAAQVAQVAVGPSSTFDLDTLQYAPAINRDIKDILRLDPRVFVDDSFVDAVQCAGGNPRFNSLTVDSVRLQDNFGLNSNGYPTERIPFSYDSIEQVSIELAPFDVQYGLFTSCNINAVTKSGGNEFHGGLFVDYTDDGFTGDSTDGIERDLGDFDELRYGFNIGGPIIKDKLFFFGSYEKLEAVSVFGATPEDTGITQAQFDEVLAIAEGYGYIAGGLPDALDVEDEKIFAKIDWNITNDHRASFTYNYNDGFNFSPSDGGSTRLSDGNHYYERGAELNAYTGALYSDWSDSFSTEFRVSYLDLDNRQIPVLGLDNFGEVQVRVPNDRGGSTTIYLGADDSRHANKLTYELWSYKAAANYAVDNHLFTFGFEREEFDVFNLFIQEVQGEWLFTSAENFASGDFADFRYENAAGTNDQNDGAAAFGYQVNTLYAQDEWTVNDTLSIVYGLRYDWYASDDKPTFNQNFFDTYGFGNDANLDGVDLLQPRIGFTYDYSNDIQFRGGLGLYSGGNPNVWISNNYSNNGVTLFECRNRGRSSDCVGDGSLTNVNDFTYAGGAGSPFIDVPDEFVEAVANADGRGPVNALDPNFEIPSDWKLSLGFVVDRDFDNFLGDNWRLQGDFLYSQVNEAAIVIPIGYEQTGVGPDGRPTYSGNTNDFLLTNADDKGRTFVYSAALSKAYDNGIDWTLAYAYTDAEDTNPMTSSVAFSNFANYSTSDPVDPQAATSNYEVAHRFTFQFNAEKEFIDRFPTRLNLVGTANEGQPYSYVFDVGGLYEPLGFFSRPRQLAYIPTGSDDPLISPLSDAGAVSDLLAFIGDNDDLNDQRGGIAERNTAADDWYYRLDLKLTQSFPGFRENDQAQAFVTIENLTNLLNDEWGILREHGFPGAAELYSVSGLDDEGRYIIDSFSNADADSIVVGASLWEVRFGLRYEF